MMERVGSHIDEKTKEILQAITGLTYKQLVTTSVEETDKIIEKQKNIKLGYDTYKERSLKGRGSVYIEDKRYVYPEDKDSLEELKKIG